MIEHSFKIGQDDFNHVETILQRYERLAGPLRQERCGVMMDLIACHTGPCALDFAAMAEGRDLDLAHDVAGIYRHFNRETGNLDDCFSPRFAKRG